MQPTEKRTVLGQLYELKASRETVKILEQFIVRDAEQDIRERSNSAQALELEERAIELANKERDMYKDKATTYEALYKALMKKPSIGCHILRILTIGIHRCQ